MARFIENPVVFTFTTALWTITTKPAAETVSWLLEAAETGKLHSLMWSVLKEFLRFCTREKKWWLIPLVVVLLLLGAILIFSASSGIAWALYPFM